MEEKYDSDSPASCAASDSLIFSLFYDYIIYISLF